MKYEVFIITLVQNRLDFRLSKRGSPQELVKHPKSIDMWRLKISPAMITLWHCGGMPSQERPGSQCCDARNKPAQGRLLSGSL